MTTPNGLNTRTKHPYHAVLQWIADGEDIQGLSGDGWIDVYGTEALEHTCRLGDNAYFQPNEFRITPKDRENIVMYANIDTNLDLLINNDSCSFNLCGYFNESKEQVDNIKVTYSGCTKELISIEMIKEQKDTTEDTAKNKTVKSPIIQWRGFNTDGFNTEKLQSYYTGISKVLPADENSKITASEAQFLSSLLKNALKDFEELKSHDKVKADVIWGMCDKNNKYTGLYYEALKQHLNRKDKTKKQANKLAAIQKKLKVLASS